MFLMLSGCCWAEKDEDLPDLILDLMDIFVQFNTTLNETKCNEDLIEVVKGLINGESWAFNMTDSTGKVPSGLARANHIFMGQYDECLNIRHPYRNFIGQYCILGYNVTAVMPYVPKIPYTPIIAMYHHGICVPSSCSSEYIGRTVYSLVFPLFNKSLSDVSTVRLEKDTCRTAEARVPFTAIDYLAISIIAIILILATLSTIYEVNHLRNKEGKVNPLFCTFSLYSNSKALLSLKRRRDDIGCFDGLRAISMAWIVYSHTVLTETYSAVANPFEEIKYARGPWALLVNNAHENVDTFFVMGGFLVLVTFMTEVQITGGFDILKSYIKRYFRLTCVLAFLLLIQVSLLDHIGSGPLMPLVQAYHKTPCVEKWYRLLLYYQNYIVDGPLCFFQSWYLAMDMQLFWISPIFLYPGIWWPKFGALLVFIMSWVITGIEFYIAYIWDLGPSITHTRGANHLSVDHFTTHTRSAPWFLGVLLGYILLYVRSDKNFKLSKSTVIWGWIICMAIFWGNFFSLLAFDGNYTQPTAALCLSLRRIGWSVGLMWIIFACSTGYGGIVNTILSWSPFHLLANLSYNVFLLHFMVLHHRIGLMRDVEYLTASKSLFNFTALYTIMNVIAIPLALLIELPVYNLTRVLLKNVTIFRLPRTPTSTPIRKKRIEMESKIKEEMNYASSSVEISDPNKK